MQITRRTVLSSLASIPFFGLTGKVFADKMIDPLDYKYEKQVSAALRDYEHTKNLQKAILLDNQKIIQDYFINNDCDYSLFRWETSVRKELQEYWQLISKKIVDEMFCWRPIISEVELLTYWNHSIPNDIYWNVYNVKPLLDFFQAISASKHPEEIDDEKVVHDVSREIFNSLSKIQGSYKLIGFTTGVIYFKYKD